MVFSDKTVSNGTLSCLTSSINYDLVILFLTNHVFRRLLSAPPRVAYLWEHV